MKEIQAQQSPLVKIVQESGLETTKAQFLLDNFSEFFKLASEWEAKATQERLDKIEIAQRAISITIDNEGFYIVTSGNSKGIGDSLDNAITGFSHDWISKHSR